MAMTDAERQNARRERMYSAGYKLMSIWVPRDSEGKAVKMERKIFLRRLEALTAGWSKTKVNKFFGDVLKIVKLKVEEEQSKAKD